MSKVLRVEELSKRYGARIAVDRVSFCVQKGQIFGLLGANGSGKSTVMKMICGLAKPSAGEIYIDDFSLRHQFRAAAGQLGCVLEAKMYDYMSGYHNLLYCARLCGLDEEAIWRAVRGVGLESRIFDRVREYSLGMRQRLAVAQGLLASPRLLVLDEPTNGMDLKSAHELVELLKRLALEGMAVLICSHNLAHIQGLCDRVGILSAGRLAALEDVGRATDLESLFWSATEGRQ